MPTVTESGCINIIRRKVIMTGSQDYALCGSWQRLWGRGDEVKSNVTFIIYYADVFYIL